MLCLKLGLCVLFLWMFMLLVVMFIIVLVLLYSILVVVKLGKIVMFSVLVCWVS